MTAPTRLDPICDKALAGGVLSPAEGLELFRAVDLPSLGLLADAVRHRLNPTSEGAPKVTYIIDRNVNPTNVCITDCGFCAFYRRPGDPEAYELTREVIYAKIEETIAAGPTRHAV